MRLSPQGQTYLLWRRSRGLNDYGGLPVEAGPSKQQADVDPPMAVFFSATPLSDDEQELLYKMIAAMGLPEGRAQVITGTMPLGAEALFLICLGAEALSLLGDKRPWSEVRGRALRLETAGPSFLATYHPRELLRHPPNKRLAWADLQVAMNLLGLPNRSP